MYDDAVGPPRYCTVTKSSTCFGFVMPASPYRSCQLVPSLGVEELKPRLRLFRVAQNHLRTLVRGGGRIVGRGQHRSSISARESASTESQVKRLGHWVIYRNSYKLSCQSCARRDLLFIIDLLKYDFTYE